MLALKVLSSQKVGYHGTQGWVRGEGGCAIRDIWKLQGLTEVLAGRVAMNTERFGKTSPFDPMRHKPKVVI